MCVEITPAKRAKEDIPVWKVMQVTGLNVVTPFRKIYEAFLSTPAPSFALKGEASEGLCYRGGYHCFKNLTAAAAYKRTINWMFDNISGYLVVKKYIIPKGEWYAEGKIQKSYFGEGTMAIRARRLKLGDEK